MTAQEKVVSDLLRRHTDTFGYVSGKELADCSGLETTAQLRQVIHSLRLQGEPICSSGAGYWYAKTDEEVVANSRKIEAFAISVLSAARGMRSKLVNQIEIDGDRYV